MNPVKVGVLGLGTVGGGTVNVLNRNADEIARRAGRSIQVVRAAAKSYDPGALEGLDRIDVGDDAFAVVDDPEIDIIVELIGGYSPARELVLKAIENGKHVVTANKALIALHGNEIFEAAHRKGVTVAFEAAVAGGIPIIKAVREGLAANRIEWIAGIINGTGNFILTEMRDKGRDFDDVLAEAQALGYAEADPTFDVEGPDLHRRHQPHRAAGRGLRGGTGLSHQAPRYHEEDREGDRDARTPDPDPRTSAHCQRGRCDERGTGEGRCCGPDTLLWGGSRFAPHRIRRCG